jgi:DNA-binding NarL/FixJ family response regulator
MLIRDGIARLLEEAGVHVVAQASSGEELLERVAATEPDVAVVDIRMPPTGSDEGVRAAKEIRTRYPGTGVLLLSQDLVPAYARELLEASDRGVGYLLKDRVADMKEFAEAIRRIAAGEVVLDAGIDVRVAS